MLKQWVPAFAVLALAPGVLAAQNQAVIAVQPTSYSDIQPSCDALKGGHFKVKSGATYVQSALSNSTNRERLLSDARRVILEAIRDNGQATSPVAWYWLGRVYLYHGDVVGADSALDKVEQLAPACTDDQRKARVQTYGALIRPAATMLQEGKADSALVLLQQAAAFYPDAPYAYQNMGIIYFNRKQLDSAAANFEKAISTAESRAASDTAIATLRNQTLFNLGVVYVNSGRFPDAIKTLRRYLSLMPNDTDAKRALANAFRGAGMPDSARVLESEMISAGGGQAAGVDPMDLGAKAFNDKNYADAVRAFSQAVQTNPYNRDALFNLVNSYLALNSDSSQPAPARQSAVDSLIAVGERLAALDPMNDAALRLVARGYQIKKVNEKTLAYVVRIDSLPISVDVKTFSRGASAANLKGSATGRGAHDASGKDLQPVAVVLVFEFLNESGSPVASEEVSVPALTAGTAHEISITPQGAGIVGWRYRRK